MRHDFRDFCRSVQFHIFRKQWMKRRKKEFCKLKINMIMLYLEDVHTRTSVRCAHTRHGACLHSHSRRAIWVCVLACFENYFHCFAREIRSRARVECRVRIICFVWRTRRYSACHFEGTINSMHVTLYAVHGPPYMRAVLGCITAIQRLTSKG